MEIRKANIIFTKNGKGFLSTKVTLPVPWVKELGFTDEDKKAIIELDKDKIIIRKDVLNMLLIKNRDGKYVGERYDYELDNGLLLFVDDWNGEAYMRALDPVSNEWNNNSFRAVYRFQEENIDLEKLEENSEEWVKATEVIGFVEE